MRLGSEKTSTRPAAVAGLFYPGDAGELRDAVTQYLQSSPDDSLRAPPKALIVPHAGYVYSGTVAGAAYASIAARRQSIRRVVLLGPSHRVYLHGIAVPRADAFDTPLGEVPVDREQRSMLIASGEVMSADAPHANEHSLEVQLPFLQVLLDDFEILPLAAGTAAPDHVASVLTRVWGREDTLILISSDLSHYHDYATAQRIDSETSAAILAKTPTLTGEQACGAVCINGLLYRAKEKQWPLSQIKRLNSGDTAGDRRRVVGYGAFAVHA
ncbi:AmmeMemoRadiSam system protein B [Povalibacter sp.]|uniref:AmmeMemoRadiSam system protein B n=1 Tax=Povalibacter sp. TaxID=1962978 RepID=UPI002F4109AC